MLLTACSHDPAGMLAERQGGKQHIVVVARYMLASFCRTETWQRLTVSFGTLLG